MHIRRTLPPAIAPIYFKDILSGLGGLARGQSEVIRFEAELKDYYGMSHCFLVSSGKVALTLILLALKDLFPGRDEVLVPGFSCYSVPSAIKRAGLTARLCDIDSESLDFDARQLSLMFDSSDNPKRFADRLLAIVPTHLFGRPADVERIRQFVDNPAVTIVEDAAQAMGGEWKGKKLGTFGDVGFFSLGRGKALSTFEGGVILTNRKDIAEKIERRARSLDEYGFGGLILLVLQTVALALFSRPLLYWLPDGLPFLGLGETIYDPHFKMRRMTSFQASLAKGWVRKLKSFRLMRKKNAEHCLAFAVQAGLHHFCGDDGVCSCLIRFPIYVEDTELRGRILNEGRKRGLGIAASYPDSLDGLLGRNTPSETETVFPVANAHARHLVTLPVHPFVTGKDQMRMGEFFSEVIPSQVDPPRGVLHERAKLCP